MLANMASSLIVHKRITTTLAKAKALRSYIEPLVTKSKTDSTHSRRVVYSYLNDKVATGELFAEVSPKIGDRPGGYTRIIKLESRLGDNADMAMIELVDFNELMIKEAKPKKARRSRRGGKKAVTETSAKDEITEAEIVEETTEEDKAEAPKETEAKTDEPAADEAPKEDTTKGEEKKEG